MTTGSTVVADYSGVGLISFDIDRYNMAPVNLNYEIDADDNGAPITFSSIVRNYTGEALGVWISWCSR